MSTYRVVVMQDQDMLRRHYSLQQLVDFAHELEEYGVDLNSVPIKIEGPVEYRILESRYPAPDIPF